MRSFMLTIALLLTPGMAAADATATASGITGKWAVDVGAAKKVADAYKKAGKDAEAFGVGFRAETKQTFLFDGQGTVVLDSNLSGPPTPEKYRKAPLKGTFKVVSAKGDVVTLEINLAGQPPETDQFRLASNSLIWLTQGKDDDGTPFVRTK